ncbi:hypothetical protein [Niallia taxi]|uniref:hypothetical protein n=1 Tax=Niallia taxi TaxID=2499688 RepID=UPI00300A57E1
MYVVKNIESGLFAKQIEPNIDKIDENTSLVDFPWDFVDESNADVYSDFNTAEKEAFALWFLEIDSYRTWIVVNKESAQEIIIDFNKKLKTETEI